MAKISNIFDGVSKLFDAEDSLLDKKFFEKNLGKILIVIILLMSYIQLRYEYENHLLALGRLKSERNDVRYTSIEKWSILTGRNRPDLIRKKVAESSVDLIETDERPVILK